MNPDLLKPFDLEADRNNEPVLWNGKDVEFIGVHCNGGIALWIDGQIDVVAREHLRMRPLAWVEERPVYKGDKLWHETGVWITADMASDECTFIDIEQDYITPIACTWTKPEPVKKTRTVKFLGYRTGCGELVLIDESEDEWEGFKRVPGADVAYEVEE